MRVPAGAAASDAGGAAGGDGRSAVGRAGLILGVGIGGEDPNEWWACGVDPKTRARRTDESLQVLRSLWTQEETTFSGKYFQLDRVRMRPKPHRAGGVVLQVGGRSDAALQRTARYADGWTGIWVSTRRFTEAGEKIAAFAAEAGRGDAASRAGCRSGWGLTTIATQRVRRSRGACRRSTSCRSSSSSATRRTGRRQQIAEFIAPYVEAGCAHVNLVIADAPEAIIERTLAVQEALRGDLCVEAPRRLHGYSTIGFSMVTNDATRLWSMKFF